MSGHALRQFPAVAGVRTTFRAAGRSAAFLVTARPRPAGTFPARRASSLLIIKNPRRFASKTHPKTQNSRRRVRRESLSFAGAPYSTSFSISSRIAQALTHLAGQLFVRPFALMTAASSGFDMS